VLVIAVPFLVGDLDDAGEAVDSNWHAGEAGLHVRVPYAFGAAAFSLIASVAACDDVIDQRDIFSAVVILRLWDLVDDFWVIGQGEAIVVSLNSIIALVRGTFGFPAVPVLVDHTSSDLAVFGGALTPTEEGYPGGGDEITLVGGIDEILDTHQCQSFID